MTATAIPETTYRIQLRVARANTALVKFHRVYDEAAGQVVAKLGSIRKGQVYDHLSHPGHIPHWADVVSDSRSPELKAAHEAQYEKWIAEIKKADANGKARPPEPDPHAVELPEAPKAAGGGRRGRPSAKAIDDAEALTGESETEAQPAEQQARLSDQ